VIEPLSDRRESASTPEPRRTAPGSYDRLEPVLVEFAGTDADDPCRASLREQLVTELLPLARNIAARYARRGEPVDDLVQVACVGLLYAIERYQPQRGHHFLSFAIPTITGEIRRHFRDKTWAMHVSRNVKDYRGKVGKAVEELATQLRRAPRPSEIAARVDMRIEEVLEVLQASHAYQVGSLDTLLSENGPANGLSRGTRLGHPDPAMELFTDSHALKPALDRLPERQRRILVMRFYQDLTQTQIGIELGISQMHVSRLLSATLAQLREWLLNDPSDYAAPAATGDRRAELDEPEPEPGDHIPGPRSRQPRSGRSLDPQGTRPARMRAVHP
jgi:RNA polymerase sigma-B factor